MMFFWSTEPLSLRASRVSPLSTCPRAHVPTCPLGICLANWPTDQQINSCDGSGHKKTRHSRDGSLGPGCPVPKGKPIRP